MNKVKARKLFDTAVTEQSRDQALIRGSQRQKERIHASAVKYLAEHDLLLISFPDHTGIGLPVANYPEFAQLSRDELTRLQVGFGGSALCLDSRDLHVSVAGLISASETLMQLAATVVASQNGRSKSEAKARAARENGQKGGRPRKLASSFSSPPDPAPEVYRYLSKETGETWYLDQDYQQRKHPQEFLQDSSITRSHYYLQFAIGKLGASIDVVPNKARGAIASYVRLGNKTKTGTGR